jgi:transcriptional regulator with XRE-family HTH domain
VSFNLQAARLNAGLSQRALAKKCKVSLSTIQGLEDGKGAHPRNAKKVADHFEVLVTDLMPLGGDDDELEQAA